MSVDLTEQEAAGANALTVAQMIRALTPGTIDLTVALREARPRALWAWYHGALALSLTSQEPWEKKLAEAIAGKIGAEAVRRCGNDGETERA